MHPNEIARKEREAISKQIQMSIQKAPEKVQSAIAMSSQLRDAYMQAQQTGTFEIFKQQRNQILSQYQVSNERINKDAIIANLDEEVSRLKTELILAKTDLFIYQLKYEGPES